MQASLFRKSAVLIEQNPQQGKLYEDVLNANGFDVYVAKSAMDGLQKIKEKKQDLTVINTEIAEENYMKRFIEKVKTEETSTDMPIVGLSIYNAECKKNIAQVLDAFLTKPLSIDKFMESVFGCIEKKVNGCENPCN